MGEIGTAFGGRDGHRWWYCTGYEGVAGVCWWCGHPFESKRPRHCCCANHTAEYDRHFEWGKASRWALARMDATCQECGRKRGYSGYRTKGYGLAYKSDVEVHHIIPLNGGNRFYSVLNCPCNLTVLCLDCHSKTRRKKKTASAKRCSQEVMELEL